MKLPKLPIFDFFNQPISVGFFVNLIHLESFYIFSTYYNTLPFNQRGMFSFIQESIISYFQSGIKMNAIFVLAIV